MKKTAMLRRMMEKKTVVAMGAQDAFSARIIERIGFDAVYLSGFASEASFLGRPDLGLMTVTERLALATNMCRAINIPLIADLEEGYGNAINVMDSIQRFESAGVAGVHIDDEVVPCRCPFLPGIPKCNLISVEEMCGKIKAAVQARVDKDFLIIARSDVIGTVPLEEYKKKGLIKETIRRSNIYKTAGADAIWVYCPSIEELKLYAASIKAPLVAILPESHLIERAPVKVYEDLGYKIVISGLATLLTAAKGMIEGLKAFKDTTDWNAVVGRRITVEECFDIVKLKEYAPLYERFKIV